MSDSSIEDSSAPLVEHLVELRSRLVKAILAIIVVFGFAFWIADHIFEILVLPFERAAGETEGLRLIYTAPQEYFFAQMRIALFSALFVAFPVIATQLYKFVAPGLYKNERRAFLPFLFATPVLFVMGACLVYFVVMPLALTFFLSMQTFDPSTGASIELLPKVSEYLSLVMTLIFAFGLVFQMPVVIALLARAGLVGSASLRRYRKYAIVLSFAAAAILTPPDPVSQIGLAVPTLLLYELSIFATRLIERRRASTENEDGDDDV